MNFSISINGEEFTYTQLTDVIEALWIHLAQWNNMEDVTKAQIIMIVKQPSKTPSIGINAQDGVEVADVFGGLPEHWNENQKELYLKLSKIAEEKGIEEARRYIQNQGK